VVLYDSRDGSPTKGEVNEFFLGEHRPIVLRIPPLVYHGFKTISGEEAFLINVCTQTYKYNAPDEFRVPPHDNDIPYKWERRTGDRCARQARAKDVRLLITGGLGLLGKEIARVFDGSAGSARPTGKSGRDRPRGVPPGGRRVPSGRCDPLRGLHRRGRAESEAEVAGLLNVEGRETSPAPAASAGP